MSKRLETLKSYFQSHAPQPLRPILTSLNGDGSWLISFPLPLPSPRRRFYHIVSDAWLSGPVTLGTSWFINIERSFPPAANNGAEVDAVIQEIEGAAGDGTAEQNQDGQWLDAIFVNFHYLDHMHQPTLVTFDKKIPLFATPEAAPIIRRWGHFNTVVTTKDFKASELPGEERWKDCHPGSPLPSWLSVFRLPGDTELHFAAVIVWSHDATQNGDSSVLTSPQKHEILLDTPHGVGVTMPSVQAFFDPALNKGSDEVEVIALLAALKDSFTFGMRTARLVVTKSDRTPGFRTALMWSSRRETPMLWTQTAIVRGENLYYGS